MGEGDAEESHQRHEEDAGEGQSGLYEILIAANQARQRRNQDAEQIALGEAVGGGTRNDDEDVCHGEGHRQDQELTPRDARDGGIRESVWSRLRGGAEEEGDQAEKAPKGEDGEEHLNVFRKELWQRAVNEG